MDKHTPPPVNPATRRRLLALYSKLGEQRLVEALDTPRHTLARAMAGLGIRRASATVIEMKIAALDGETAQ